MLSLALQAFSAQQHRQLRKEPGFAQKACEYCASIVFRSASGEHRRPRSYCPEGTALPIPTPKGFYAAREGTVSPARCIPGRYAPTIQSEMCLACPPGTACENDGTSEATICAPGYYRSVEFDDNGNEVEGQPCRACPQGTWSKNWELREVGECLKCATGTVCSVDGMTTPCDRDDLPGVFEPVADLDGEAVETYRYASFRTPTTPYTEFECLLKNGENSLSSSTGQTYFYGELVPPFIDVLGRGVNFRPSTDAYLKYNMYPPGSATATTGGCYRNTRRYGSTLYMRMKDFHGPSFDRLTGTPHQGYGTDSETYFGFYGRGSLSIDLPSYRLYFPALNCTRGYKLMNETLNPTASEMVYTSPRYDIDGGGNRYIERGEDQWYPGTCEADIICDTESEAQAEACSEGYVCDQTTNSTEASYYPCREGYACDFGTTPDRDLQAPQSQFTTLCAAGYVCSDGTGFGQSLRESCPEDHFCPAGTAEPRLGAIADDSINRGLGTVEANPSWLRRNLKYLTDNDMRLVGDHDDRCFDGVDASLKVRWRKSPAQANANIISTIVQPARAGGVPPIIAPIETNKPVVLNEAKARNAGCARDHKWRLVQSAIQRFECDCETQYYTIIAIYRLWKCTSNGTILPLGLASLSPTSGVEGSTQMYRGGRDFWFAERENRTLRQCLFNSSADEQSVNLTHGKLPTNVLLARSGEPMENAWRPGADGAVNLSAGLAVSLTATSIVTFITYADLYAAVVSEYETQKNERLKDERKAVDPFTFDLHVAVSHIEEHGEYLEQLISMSRKHSADAMADFYKDYVPMRLDMCECQNLLRCPNGTSAPQGSRSIFDCKPCCSGYKDETASECWSTTLQCSSRVAAVLKRIDALPTWSIENYAGTDFVVKRSDVDPGSSLDYTELTGTVSDTLGHIRLETFDVASFTFDLRELANNITYGDHYRLSVYEDCKPCPIDYACDYSATSERTELGGYDCTLPTSQGAEEYAKCLATRHVWTCINATTPFRLIAAGPNCEHYTSCNGTNTERCLPVASSGPGVRRFKMPDRATCARTPFYCSTKTHAPFDTMEALPRQSDNRDYLDNPDALSLTALSALISLANTDETHYCQDHEDFMAESESAASSSAPGVMVCRRDYLEGGDDDHTLDHETTAWLQRDHLNAIQQQGCCSCEARRLPRFFRTKAANPGFPDNMHALVQASFTSVASSDVDLTITWELMNGMYYRDFQRLKDQGDLLLHRPSRAARKAKTFLAVLTESQVEAAGIAMPLNMPFTTTRANPEPFLEPKIVINRPSDITLSDPDCSSSNPANCPTRRGNPLARIQPLGVFGYTKRKALRLNITDDELNSRFVPSKDRRVAEDVYPVDDNVFDGLYGVADSFLDVRLDDEGQRVGPSEFWESYADKAFLATPWLPFFSNCRGYDSHVSISKLLETHPNCTLESRSKTQPIYWYIPWESDPTADRCHDPSSTLAAAGGLANSDTAWLDWQGVEVACQYEEELTDQSVKFLRWYEAPPGTTLFYLTAKPIGRGTFARASGSWGRNDKIGELEGSRDLIEVVVDQTNYGERGALPSRMVLSIFYFQQDKAKKRIVAAQMQFKEKCKVAARVGDGQSVGNIPNCETVYNDQNTLVSERQIYHFEIIYEPLRWFELLNYFEFPDILYFVFYTVVGFVTIFESVVVWSVNRLLTRLRHPPLFHGTTLFYAIAEAPAYGVFLAAIPLTLALIVVYQWLSPTDQTLTLFTDFVLETDVASRSKEDKPQLMALENYPAAWADTGNPGYEQKVLWRKGRSGLCFVSIGLYTLYVCAKLIIPNWDVVVDKKNDGNQAAGILAAAEDDDDFDDDDDDGLPPSPTWAPNTWKRAHWAFGLIVMMFYLTFLLEFSYSDVFGDKVYSFLLVFYFVDIGIGMILENTLTEKLLIAPFTCTIGVVEAVMTMGAASFVEFTVSYMINLSITMIDRLYMGPGISWITTLWPRWRMMIRRKFKSRRRMTRGEKAKEELEWRRINEEIELANEGVEPLLDSFSSYSEQVTAMLIGPALNLFMMFFPEELQITERYNIKNFMSKYFLFAIYTPLFLFAADVYILNTQELVFGKWSLCPVLVMNIVRQVDKHLWSTGWKVYDYVSYQKYRFSVRNHRWMMNSKILDESIAESMQTLDLLCFSSQYYFVLALTAFAVLLCLMGITVFLRARYDPFGDPAMPLIICVICLLGEIISKLLFRLADVRIGRFGWRGLWMTKQIEGTVDDDVAVKLAIGEGRQADLEQERLELQALNSERFRHRFLERNRPWILQHLVELLTPRSLQSPGPDGRPVVEYIRDVYAELMAMGEGRRAPGDREDISSDDEDEMEKQRASWSRAPLQGASLLIARLWLEKARKRRAFMKQVRGIIEANKADRCAVTGRTEAMGAKLVCTLARDGKPDKNAIDALIAGFEETYGVQERDVNLWKAYFRANAEFITLDQAILDARERERVARMSLRPLGAERKTRPDDVSSDEEDDEVIFDPLVVVRSSPEGRMLSKWLGAARARLGGSFPKPEAHAAMERYAEKMRKRKLQGGKQKIAGHKGPDEERAEEESRFTKRVVRLNAASTALARRWLRAAQDSISKRFDDKSRQLRDDCSKTLARMPPEDEWYYGMDLVTAGRQIIARGEELQNTHLTLEAEAAVRIRRIEAEYSQFEGERRDAVRTENDSFEKELAEKADKAQADLELRMRELERERLSRRDKCDEEESRAREEDGAASTEMLQRHRELIDEIDEEIRRERQLRERERSTFESEQRHIHERKMEIEEQTIIDRRISAITNIRNIRKESHNKMKQEELDWQSSAAQWLGTAKRKVQLKQREDMEAAAKKRRRRKVG